MIQKERRDKFPKISILLSHLCVSIVVVKLPPEPHNLRHHFCINRSTFISHTSCLHACNVSYLRELKQPCCRMFSIYKRQQPGGW